MVYFKGSVGIRMMDLLAMVHHHIASRYKHLQRCLLSMKVQALGQQQIKSYIELYSDCFINDCTLRRELFIIQISGNAKDRQKS